MALQAQAQLLDELMGKFRNVAPGDKVNSTRFDDSDVCKFHLCGFCPHDLFVNTKADLGPCTKIHDDDLKRQYEKSSRFCKLGYEEDFERFLRNLLNDVEKKIKRGMDRLKLTQTETNNMMTPLQMRQEKVAQLKEKINTLIKQAESLGEEGQIEEAQSTLQECEKYKSECRYLENQLESNPHALEQKQMEVCEICGSFLIVNDAQSRVEEHMLGKQHSGYAKVRSTLDDMKKKRLKDLEDKEKEREREREKIREKERKRREEVIKSHRDRSKERSKRSRSRSKDRKRSKYSRSRSRSRSRRERTKRSRSNERKHSSRQHKSKSPDRSNENGRSRDNGKQRDDNGSIVSSKSLNKNDNNNSLNNSPRDSSN